jgi:hypothetical protein
MTENLRKLLDNDELIIWKKYWFGLFIDNIQDEDQLHPKGSEYYDEKYHNSIRQLNNLKDWYSDEDPNWVKSVVPVGSTYGRNIVIYDGKDYRYIDMHYSLKDLLKDFKPLDKARIEEIILEYGDPKLYPEDFYLFKNRNVK